MVKKHRRFPKYPGVRYALPAGVNTQLVPRQLMLWQRPRLQARYVVSDRDGIFIFVSGPVNNFIDHCPKKIIGLS